MMSSVFLEFLDGFSKLQDDSDGGNLPPNIPPAKKYEGPWFTTQIAISSALGLASFLVFSHCRTRWPLLFAPRTKLKGFSPHEVHAHQAFFGWVMPTIRTSEYTILQIVGLDAAVLLGFYKMSFYLFSVCSIFAVALLMPMNWHNNNLDLGGKVGNSTDDDPWDWPDYAPPGNGTTPDPGKNPGWFDLISDADSYLTVHFLFTYLFTFIVLWFTYKNYRRFVRWRQLFSLELVHSIPARTVMVTKLPNHLQGERALAEYFENIGLAVESVSVCRDIGSLRTLLDRRTKALLKLESEWVRYVGNPSSVESYDPSDNAPADGEPSSLEGQPGRLVVPQKKRPTLRPGWFKSKIDALEFLEAEFRKADESVKKWRRSGKFKSSHAAFVTFEKMSSAQIAIQTAHAPLPYQCNTYAAPEPRDVIWANMSHSLLASRFRELIVFACMVLLLLFWLVPITALASLLSYKEIKKTLPWLGNLIDKSETVRAFVQNSLPSLAMVSLNASVPFLLEMLTYIQGYRARSWIEYSLMKKYFLFLLVNVVFVFLLASTYWQLVQDLANSPAKIPERVAEALQQGRARHFFLSYVILQGFGIMPLQLLNLGVVVPRIIMRMFVTRTPRDFAELNAPPMINYGVVYPQSILVFVVTILYSVIQPTIVIFGACYFGIAYVVYKYKLLFVFYKPYESQGQAWPITFIRLIWGVTTFLVFMIGIFSLKKSVIMAACLLPLLGGTLVWAWYLHSTLNPLSKYVNLSSVFEVQRGEESADVMRLRAGHPVTWSQSNLNRRRYAQNDETLYVAPEDERTDYSQPPMANWYRGVLNTGKRRYGHPALLGVLPQPWLPLKKGQTLVSGNGNGGTRAHKKDDQAVVLTLRKRHSIVQRGVRQTTTGMLPGSKQYTDGDEHNGVESQELALGTSDLAPSNPWEETLPGPSHRSQTAPQPLHHRLSYDHASGVIMLPEGQSWMMEDDDSDSDEDYGTPSPIQDMPTTPLIDTSIPSGASAPLPSDTLTLSTPSKRRSMYSTYYHHPERRSTRTIPGAFEQE